MWLYEKCGLSIYHYSYTYIQNTNYNISQLVFPYEKNVEFILDINGMFGLRKEGSGFVRIRDDM